MVDNWVHISQICDEIFGKVYKDMGNGEERYTCPFHDDTNPSCDVNKSKGVYVCRACGKAGSLYDLAKEYNYPKPHLYIPNNGYGYVDKPPAVHIPNPPVVTPSIIETIEHSQQYLNEHLDLIPSNWNKDVVKELGIGRHQNQWLYPYYNYCEPVGYKLGKIDQKPKGIKCRVFPSMDYINKYDKKVLYIFEGEPDCITGISLGLQGISFTAGAGSIPRGKDGKYALKWLLKWKIIVICYDNDKAGRDGAIKLKNELMKVANNG